MSPEARWPEPGIWTSCSVTLRSTLRDSNTHLVSPSTSYDYLLSDDTHPTRFVSATILSGILGSGSTTTGPDFTAAQIVGGKNPVWNQYGHERMGQALSVSNPAAP